ncbi:MAG: bifunctional diaminohydroxyphosphoribosylaminopyrimidine deaminase/5-amino-6-(5-phosphoribosylamino)uracil reductase RibD [Desulfobulbaceae bacterium]|nr:bifunctional diaminohydroxyphosphoribosylaminopyrimidine deaminase/5-amino-6-(5-phosphoribosylamino)uracil reductase RibD [Desulfobulbaceae bacterium]
MNQDDALYMRLAIQEAEKGRGRTSPNPCVGAVIVRDDTVVGRGWHRRAGTPHAEVNAISDAGAYAVGATIYVTLEPCNHTARTPPCTGAILDAGLARVVVGMPDPNPAVAGGGNAYLQSRGIAVESGVLEEECRAINRPFIKHSATGMPWVVMKAGMSLDGKITYRSGRGGRITGEESQRFTHGLRNTLDALLVGIDTVIIDDPSLTTRLPETDDARDPLRVVLDTNLRLSPDAGILRQQSAASTWIYCSPDAPADHKERLVDAGAIIHPVEITGGRPDIRAVLAHLGSRDVTSVLVEGGATIHGALLENDLADEVYLFTAPFFIGEQGTSLLAGFSGESPDACPRLDPVDCRKLGQDLLIHGLVRHYPAP